VDLPHLPGEECDVVGLEAFGICVRLTAGARNERERSEHEGDARDHRFLRSFSTTSSAHASDARARA
jgi:hypothetical protein